MAPATNDLAGLDLTTDTSTPAAPEKLQDHKPPSAPGLEPVTNPITIVEASTEAATADAPSPSATPTPDSDSTPATDALEKAGEPSSPPTLSTADIERETSGLKLDEKALPPEPELNEKRAATPEPVTPSVITSPPPPPPPPKDDARGMAATAKEGKIAAQGRLHIEPPLTPVPSRPSTPLPPNEEKAREQGSDDENDTEIHHLFEKSQTAEAQHPSRSSSLGKVGEGSETAPEAGAKTPGESSAGIKPAEVGRPTVHRPPPPDEDLPFDFHRFLSQLRHRSADPVAKFLRSFLHEFAKKQWTVSEQVKIVRDFLTFIYGKMDQCDVWREVGDQELDNAYEGMEKLVMNRLYTQTFSPAIPPHDPTARYDERFPGRRGQHQEDVERDEVLTQKVRIYSWIREEHLDIGDTITGEGGRRFLDLAVKEMLKIGSYRAPRDKVICVLNCCKVIFGLLRHSKSDESADKFVPLLIYVVLRANPEHLVSNVQYILRFRNPDKLNGEAGYYLSSLMGAIQFIENLDRSSLTITPEEFERNVEAAVAAIAERPPPSPPRHPRNPSPHPPQHSDDEPTEDRAVAGLLRTIQRPLSSIGRIFTDNDPIPASVPQRRHSPAPDGDPILTALGGRRHQQQHQQHHQQNHPGRREREEREGRERRDGMMSAEEAAARQASAEAEEARRIQRMEYENVVEILKGMFPGLDREVIGDVVRMKEGRVGLAVDACLVLSAN